MAEKTNLRLMALAVMVVLIGTGSAWAVDVLEPGYNVETYASYSAPGIGRGPYHMVFVPDGNLYVTHVDDDSIWRITPEGVATEFISVNDAPQGIVWGGGTEFGDYLYVRFDNYNIVRVGLDGTISNFAYKWCTGALGIDRTGNYGGEMYTTTGCQDHTYRIDFSGNVSLFSDFPGWNDGGGPREIGFDIQGDYGGLMYIAVEFSNSAGNQHKSGLFSLDPDGNSTRFAEGLVRVGRVEFDLAGFFGGEMYVMGTQNFDESNTLWRVAPDGTATEFARAILPQGISDLTFGPDGAMYVGEYDSSTGTVIINRIYFVEEVVVDVKPGSCPNPLNVKSKGFFPVAILGSDALDVGTIVISSLRLAGVAPVRDSYEDVAAAGLDVADCTCIEDGPDGFIDLTLKFETQQIVEALGEVDYGDILILELTGVLFDETPIEGADCIIIRGGRKLRE